MLANGKRTIWLAFPRSNCSGNFAAVVGRLPEQIPEIETASLSYNHGFSFPEPEKNFAVAILTVTLANGVDTATALELLNSRTSLALRDGAVLTRNDAEKSGLLTGQ